MKHFPIIPAEAEDAYRHDRVAEQFRRQGGRSHRANRGGAARLRWNRRHDRVTD
ncbi:MAG TPA: hypothetical protein VGL21_17290 [Jatrophihabitantaceae bacterium]|jgi:hypothetical protein